MITKSRTLLCALLLQFAAGMKAPLVADGRSVRERTEEQRQTRADPSCGMMAIGCVAILADNTCVPVGTCIGKCCHGCWMAVPSADQCATGCGNCVDGCSSCMSETGKCLVGSAVWVGKDCCAQAIMHDCCWQGLAKGCCYDGVIKGCVVPCGEWCVTGKCITDAGDCICCMACGCKGAVECIGTSCCSCMGACGTECVKCGGDCVSMLGKCANGCITCIGKIRPPTCAEWASCISCLGNCCTDVCCGLLKCCRDDLCCYQNWCTAQECADGCIHCGKSCGQCLECVACAIPNCMVATPACLIGTAACCATNCGACWTQCGKDCAQCGTDCNQCCGDCTDAMKLKGQKCLTDTAAGCYQLGCVSIPANAHAGVMRARTTLGTTMPMRVGQAFSKNLPRQGAWASTAGSIKSQQLSALGASAGSKIYHDHPNRLLREIGGYDEEQVTEFMVGYYHKLDHKWATNQAWTAFWRGDAAIGIEGRNSQLARYKGEFRRRYNLAMCANMDTHWHAKWADHYPSYTEKYMADLVAAGKIPAQALSDAEYQALETFLMSSTAQMAEFNRIVTLYEKSEGREVPTGSRAEIRREYHERTVADSRLPLAGAAVREAAPLTAQVLRDARAHGQGRPASVGQQHWTCRGCGFGENSMQFNPRFCGNPTCRAPRQQ